MVVEGKVVNLEDCFQKRNDTFMCDCLLIVQIHLFRCKVYIVALIKTICCHKCTTHKNQRSHFFVYCSKMVRNLSNIVFTILYSTIHSIEPVQTLSMHILHVDCTHGTAIVFICSTMANSNCIKQSFMMYLY